MNGEERETVEGVVSMPSFGDAYSDEEIAAVTNFVTSRFGSVGSKLTGHDIAKFRTSGEAVSGRRAKHAVSART